MTIRIPANMWIFDLPITYDFTIDEKKAKSLRITNLDIGICSHYISISQVRG